VSGNARNDGPCTPALGSAPDHWFLSASGKCSMTHSRPDAESNRRNTGIQCESAKLGVLRCKKVGVQRWRKLGVERCRELGVERCRKLGVERCRKLGVERCRKLGVERYD